MTLREVQTALRCIAKRRGEMRSFEAAIHDKVLQRGSETESDADSGRASSERSELSDEQQKMVDKNLQFLMLRKKAEASARGRTG